MERGIEMMKHKVFVKRFNLLKKNVMETGRVPLALVQEWGETRG
jgi:hypothetical protein